MSQQSGNHLPSLLESLLPEIQNSICDYLTASDASSLSRCSRQLYQVIVPYVYKHIVLDASDYDSLDETLSGLVEADKRQSKLHLVRKISIIGLQSGSAGCNKVDIAGAKIINNL